MDTILSIFIFRQFGMFGELDNILFQGDKFEIVQCLDYRSGGGWWILLQFFKRILLCKYIINVKVTLLVIEAC